MNEQIRKYYKIIPLGLIFAVLMSCLCLDSFAGTHLGLADAVKSRVQQLKEEKEKKEEESIAITISNDDEINQLPVISSLTANYLKIPIAAVTTITCSASDPDNDPLAYSWSVTSGTIAGTGSKITWTAPAAIGLYTIYCAVSDGKSGTTQKSVNIAVTPLAWTKQFGTSTLDEGVGVAADASGNVYVTGYTNGDLDGNTNQGSADIFLTKYDTAGTRIWTKQLGTSGSDQGWGVATDPSGNIYVTGCTFGDLDGNANQGSGDIFLIKYDTNGTRIWTRQPGTTVDDAGLGVATDHSGNIYVTGYTFGNLDDNINQGWYDIFLIKYDTSGAKLWARQFGTNNIDEGLGLATDPAGDIYVTGYTNGALNGDTNQGSTDIFLTKYNAAGTRIWTKQLGTSGSDQGWGVATDSSGDIYVTGYTFGDLDHNTNQGSGDTFLTKYDTNGTKVWTRQLGTSVDDAGLGVATDQSGNIYVTGMTLGNLDSNINQGRYDIFSTMYDANGIKLWTRQLGTSVDDEGLGVATDAAGSVYVTGWTNGNLDGNINQGGYDMVLIKIVP